MTIGKPPPSRPGCVTTGPRRPCSRRPYGRRGLLAYVEQALVPEFQPHDIVIMDICRQTIEAAAGLPPYSSDFNPIEMADAKLKAALRAAEARTIPDLWQAIADALRRFTSQECANCLAAAGYDATSTEKCSNSRYSPCCSHRRCG
jgi:transposase